jgi:hypothetical protein
VGEYLACGNVGVVNSGAPQIPVRLPNMIYAIGDIHGCLEKLQNLLEREGITENSKWAAGNAHLVFLGDYTDRGEDGIGVIELVMRLEQEAAGAGGQVTALLGNHDVILLEAHWFGDEVVS